MRTMTKGPEFPSTLLEIARAARVLRELSPGWKSIKWIQVGTELWQEFTELNHGGAGDQDLTALMGITVTLNPMLPARGVLFDYMIEGDR